MQALGGGIKQEEMVMPSAEDKATAEGKDHLSQLYGVDGEERGIL